MKKKISKNIDRHPGLTADAVKVAMAPSRALTSHARRHYVEHYKPRYGKLAPWLFAFDAFLVGIVVALLVFVFYLWFFTNGPLTGVGAELVAPSISASDVTPIQAVLTSTDGQAHQDVEFRFDLAPYVEVLSETPAPAANGWVSVGSVSPATPQTVRALVRVLSPVGSSVPFGLELRTPTQVQSLRGTDFRSVASSTLSVSLPNGVPTLLADGATLPIQITNRGRTTRDGVTLRLTGNNQAPNATLGIDGTTYFDAISTTTPAFAFLPLGSLPSQGAGLSLELDDHAHEVATTTINVVHWTDVTSTPVIAIENRDGVPALTLQSSAAGTVFVFSPDLPGGLASFAFTSGTNVFALPSAASSSDLVAMPAIQTSGGLELLPAVTLHPSQSLPLAASVRYYAATGDQLGVGPLPLKAGSATTLWVVADVGPSQAALGSVRLSAKLADGVTFTGRSLTPPIGSQSENGSSFSWSADSIPAGAPVQIAFEISLTPNKADVGQVAQILSSLTLEAKDAQSGQALHADLSGLTTQTLKDKEGNVVAEVVK